MDGFKRVNMDMKYIKLNIRLARLYCNAINR